MNGPNWNMVSNGVFIPCRQNWLASLLMTSNFDISLPDRFPVRYISSDYQLFMLAPLSCRQVMMPDSHLVSYAIGMLTGYVIRYKPNLYFGGRVGETILWITCTTSSFAAIYWINHFYDIYYPLTTTETLLMMAFSKPLYLLGWVWLFYACSTGRGVAYYGNILSGSRDANQFCRHGMNNPFETIFQFGPVDNNTNNDNTANIHLII
ncbi:unnamed protein product [Oppiella nova]|uniref:Uncharacterized protein n=1 Tax=Oppiella nova TaxID=334625 RepID=A0A7R9QM41_9ACAR|nr:unnamed protein product [Oppiella nova]CAG2168595.1 unnamed protein product [Oppiella nova]